jgi:hypothetical protein
MKLQSVSSDSYPDKNGNKNDRRPDALVKLDDYGAGSTRNITYCQYSGNLTRSLQGGDHFSDNAITRQLTKIL